MRTHLLILIFSTMMLAQQAYAEDEFFEVIVVDPYLEMHTGPAIGYPVTQIIERDKKIKILKRKTDWFKIRTPKNKEGWVHISELSQTLTLDGKKTAFKNRTIEDFRNRKWEIGLLSGNFEGAASLTLLGNYYFTPTLSTEVSFTQAIGNFSSSLMANIRLTAHPFPEWRVSPFFALGTGIIDTSPSGTLVQTIDRTDPVANFSLGANIYLTKRFILRMEYNQYKVFTSRNDNEEVAEWKAGIVAFF